jgi:hypothetical protein
MIGQDASCEINKGNAVVDCWLHTCCLTNNTQVSYVAHFLLLAALGLACSCPSPAETWLLAVNCAVGAVRGSSTDNGPARSTQVYGAGCA